MNTNYHRNKQRAIYNNTEPSMTDQGAARDTDINVIVKSFLIHGQAPGTTQEALYADFTEMPDDLAGYIERSKQLEQHRRLLPKQLQDLPLEELLALTPEKLTAILTPATPAAPAEPEGPK